MKVWARRILFALVALAALAAAALALGWQLAERKMHRRVEAPTVRLALPEDAQALERGRYLFASRGCAECHGANGAGRKFVDEGGLVLAAPNITPGGAAVARYQPEDWVRTIRHGVKPTGEPVMVMPSEDYNRLTDQDVAALVAYVRRVPAQPGGAAVIQLPPPVRALYGFGMIRDAAAKIDHGLPPPVPVPAGVTAEHGAYVANMCIGCHGAQLAGGKIPGGPPDWPAAANLTPGEGGVMGRYPDAAALKAMFRSGRRPDGSVVKVMPFESLRELSDVDVEALYLHLRALPPRKAG